GSRTTVFAEHRTPLVASQLAVTPLERNAAEDADDPETDPTADPHADPIEGVMGTPSGPEQQPAAVGGTPDTGAAAEQSPAPEPSPLAEAPATPVASPEAVAEAAPSPAPAARARPDPGPRGAPRAAADLPIVMYHHVGLLPPNPDVFRRDLTVPPDV